MLQVPNGHRVCLPLVVGISLFSRENTIKAEASITSHRVKMRSNFIVFSENAGLLGLTRVGSRRVIQISAGFMFFFSILGEYVLHVAPKSSSELKA